MKWRWFHIKNAETNIKNAVIQKLHIKRVKTLRKSRKICFTYFGPNIINMSLGPVLRDTLIVTFVDAVVSMVCGVAVFSVLGNLAYEQVCIIDENIIGASDYEVVSHY